jgi:hypothetical protein
VNPTPFCPKESPSSWLPALRCSNWSTESRRQPQNQRLKRRCPPLPKRHQLTRSAARRRRNEPTDEPTTASGVARPTRVVAVRFSSKRAHSDACSAGRGSIGHAPFTWKIHSDPDFGHYINSASKRSNEEDGESLGKREPSASLFFRPRTAFLIAASNLSTQ